MSPAAAIGARRGRIIGREVELETIRDLVLHGDGRLVTLTGAGGCGKTSLALESARRLEGVLTDGAAWIDLAVIRDPDAITLACCDSLGLIEQRRPPDAVLEAHLAPRQMLIVLDNCEHLLAALVPLVDRLLDRCPDLRILATSRARLRVPGETVFVVPPLPVPALESEFDPDRLRQAPAVELFVERAVSVNPAFALEDWGPAVASICRRLDGLPLAIELAAAYSAALTPPEIEQRLTAALGSSPPAAGVDRQRTMDAALDWSHDLLDETERVLFRRLAVFAGGWTLEAAEQVCSLEGDTSTLTPTLVSLVEHSLVVREQHEAGSRFRMLTPVAEYAARRLADSGDLAPTSLAHAQHYLAVTTPSGPDWRLLEPDQLDRIAVEYDNCLAAMRFAEGAGNLPIVLAFDISLLVFWRVRGMLRSGQRRLEATLALLGEQPTRERGLVLAGMAHFSQLLGELGSAAERVAEAEAILEAVGDVIGQRTAIGFAGDVAADHGDFDAARRLYARARDLGGVAENPLDLGFWHANVGRTATRSGDLATGERELEQAEGHLRPISGWYLAHVLVQLGSLSRRRGDLDRAQGRLEEALGHLRRYGAAVEAVACLDELARVALDRRQFEQAATLFAAATGLRDSTALAMSAADRKALATDVDRVRAALPPSRFAAAWARGRDLSLDEASEFSVTQAADPTTMPPPPRGSILTPREREVATLVAEGLSNARIAERLAIAPGTARIHVERILGKLGFTSRVQIARLILGGPSVGSSRSLHERD